MADNFLERQYDDYQRAKAHAKQQRRLQWRRRLEAYKRSLQSSADSDKSGDDAKKDPAI